jgi:hypothetical protein
MNDRVFNIKEHQIETTITTDATNIACVTDIAPEAIGLFFLTG